MRGTPPTFGLLVLAAWSAAPAGRVQAYDCNRNGIEDRVDVDSQASPDCNGNRVPDECDIAPVNYTLTWRGTLPIGSTPVAIVAADLDLDGDADLGVANHGGTISVLLNRGDGTFPLPVHLEVPELPRALVAADFDGDGRLDLAVGGEFVVLVFRNAAQGRFVLSQRIVLDATLAGLTAIDLDEDGDLDLAAAGSFRLTLLINRQDSAFEAAPRIPIGSDPVAVAPGDVDGDRDLDLVTANALDNVTVLFNDASGAYPVHRSYAAGTRPRSMAAADLDGDRDPDLAIANGDGGVTVLRNPGNGAFHESALLPIKDLATSIAAADLDLDGDLDLAVGLQSAGVAVLLNHGDASFGAAAVPAMRLDVSALATADLDGDLSPELVVASPETNAVSFLWRQFGANSNDCDGDSIPDECRLTGADCNHNGIPDGCDVASGRSRDCDADRLPDECEVDCDRNGVPDACDIAAGAVPDCNRNGTPDACDLAGTLFFREGGSTQFAETAFALEPADLNGDGTTDVAAAAVRGLEVFLNEGSGSLRAAGKFLAGQFLTALVSGDFDGDGDVDLVAAHRLPDEVSFLRNTGEGTFGFAVRKTIRGTPFRLAAADFDGDADLDLAAGNADSFDLVALLNDGGAGFVRGSPVPLGGLATMIQPADLDGDGAVDLAAALEVGLAVFRNDGTGSFTPFLAKIPELKLHAIVPADLDGDRDIDLAAGAGSEVFLVFNDGTGRNYTLFKPSMVSQSVVFPAVFDADGDGSLDFAIQAGDFGGVSPVLLSVFLNEERGSFRKPVDFALADSWLPTALVPLDLDGDGGADLVSASVKVCPNCDQTIDRPRLRSILNESALPVSRDFDRDDIPDECGRPRFHRGDADGDGGLNLTDAITVLGHLYLGGRAPGCREAADAQNDGKIDLADAVAVLAHLFQGGPPPAPPAGPCGTDPDPVGSAGDLGCEAYGPCA